MSHAVISGLSDIAQFLVPALVIAWADPVAFVVMSLIYSTLFAAAFYRWGTRVVAAMAVAVFSHFILDVLSHNPDMDLWPHSAIEMGLGPYLGGLGGWFELLVSVAGCAVYVLGARRNRTYGRSPVVVCAMVALTYIAEVMVVQG